MSRIDEALKRRSGGGPAPQKSGVTKPVPVDVHSILDHYPREAGDELPPVETRVEAPAPLAVQEVAAPRPAARVSPPAGPIQTKPDVKLVIGKGASPVCIEQYRRLAGAVHGLQVDRGLKTLMVTSAVPGCAAR